MLRRLLIATFVTASLQGCLATHSEKIYVRRVPPTKEELDAMPPESYEAVLRRDDARRQRLLVPNDVHDETRYLDAGRREMAEAARSPQDPWASYEEDRIRVLQKPVWADVGASPAPEVFPKSEPPVEADPFAPVPKSAKKKDDAPAEGGDKPAEGDKPADMGGEKKDAPAKGDGTNKN